jgi:hypothetical protein
MHLDNNQSMDQSNAKPPEETAVIRRPMTLEEKLRLIYELRGITAALPSGTDMLLEDRRLERAREWAEEGW